MLEVILLAGGRSQRMGGQLPKVLYLLGGRPLLAHLIESVKKLKPDNIFIVYNDPVIPKQLSHFSGIQWVCQTDSLGTGDAVKHVLPLLNSNARVLVLPGDAPLLSTETLESFIQGTALTAVGLITAEVESPAGLGRIIRNSQQKITAIVEEKAANLLERQIHEVNASIYLLAQSLLKKWVPCLSNHNVQQEYYLTDMIAHASQEGVEVQALKLVNAEEIQGVNTPKELALVQSSYKDRQINHLLRQGLRLKDSKHTWLYGNVSFGENVIVDHNVTFEGNVQLGDNTYIGPYTILRDVSIASNVTIVGHCFIRDVSIQKGVKIGPFVHIHDRVQLLQDSVVGNFVEITRSKIGEGSKMKHLSYLGDVVMGQRVNIGAGTVTCNYDGVTKHETHLQDEAQVGALTAIVAPREIGARATIGAGSVITKDAPAHRLTLSRSPQVTVEEWQRPVPKKKASHKEEALSFTGKE